MDFEVLFFEFPFKKIFFHSARKKFRSTDDEQEDRQDDGDQEKYQPSGSDDDEEEDLESAVSDEEDSADASADQDDVDQATPSKRRQKDVQSDHLVGSRSTVKFAKLHTLWRRSLEVLGYAKCESDNCDHMATSLSDIVAHFKACRSKQDDRRRLSCAVRACRFRCAIEGRLVRHYIKNHSMNLTKAREMAKEKKEVLPDWRPTQKEIDVLRLFD
jgi:cobalamin biosynthesis protein CobT